MNNRLLRKVGGSLRAEGRRALVIGGLTAATLNGACRGEESSQEGNALATSLATIAADAIVLQSEQPGRATEHAGNSKRGPVLVNVWATWCTPCREEFPLLESLASEYEDVGLTVIALNVEDAFSRPRVLRFVEDVGITFPVWSDSTVLPLTKHGITGLPTSILFDRDGREQWRRVGMLLARDPELQSQIRNVLRHE